ncbi:hypothetical protein T492DRAFT_982640 [Pavlovales sp. CCMP2436]|nr:hypothetical protein T492DRAFT_982640 [Pavlovales sp. CCMP2436]|mmetsp:Transcript_33535/g.83564  ORF Transcript_33535/g.83564 Transcript_33535/m.83564 type:complete len:240 (-) Transcript_33535:287-1006(-)
MTALLNTALNTILGACGGLSGALTEERFGLARAGAEAATPEPKSMFGSLADRARSLAGVEAPDPAFEAALKLLTDPVLLSFVEKGGTPEMARFVASADGSMLTWQCLELNNNMPKFSGAISLSSITRVEQPAVSVMASWLTGPRAYAIVIYTAAEQVRIEAGSEPQRNEYATALDLASTKLRVRNTADRADRKIARHAAKEMDMMGKRHNAEKRKQEILDSMNSNGGMKHTAVAMASRS